MFPVHLMPLVPGLFESEAQAALRHRLEALQSQATGNAPEPSALGGLPAAAPSQGTAAHQTSNRDVLRQLIMASLQEDDTLKQLRQPGVPLAMMLSNLGAAFMTPPQKRAEILAHTPALLLQHAATLKKLGADTQTKKLELLTKLGLEKPVVYNPATNSFTEAPTYGKVHVAPMGQQTTVYNPSTGEALQFPGRVSVVRPEELMDRLGNVIAQTMGRIKLPPKESETAGYPLLDEKGQVIASYPRKPTFLPSVRQKTGKTAYYINTTTGEVVLSDKAPSDDFELGKPGDVQKRLEKYANSMVGQEMKTISGMTMPPEQIQQKYWQHYVSAANTLGANVLRQANEKMDPAKNQGKYYFNKYMGLYMVSDGKTWKFTNVGPDGEMPEKKPEM